MLLLVVTLVVVPSALVTFSVVSVCFVVSPLVTSVVVESDTVTELVSGNFVGEVGVSTEVVLLVVSIIWALGVLLVVTTVVVPSPFVTCFVVLTDVVPSSLKRVVVVTEPVVFSVMPVV